MAKAPKKFHTEVGTDIYNQLRDVVKENHKELIETSFLILFKHGGWESKGRRILGKAKVVGEDMRSTFGKDAVIYLNRDAWHMLSVPQKKYLLDHELCHLDIIKDKNYDTVLAADGRPKLTTAPHDLEDFIAVVKRHGIIMEDVKRLVKTLSDAKQITIDDVVKLETNEDEPAVNAATDEEKDENQAALIVEGDKILDPMAGVVKEGDEQHALLGQDIDENEQSGDNVADLGKERAKRVTKKEKEAAKLAKEAARLAEEPQQAASDDDLPF